MPRIPTLSYDDDTIIAESVRMRGVLALVKLVAESDLPVLISGEAGTGKKLLGGEIHRLSGRSGKPLLIMDCMALPDTLIFSELFGGFCSRLAAGVPSDTNRAGYIERRQRTKKPSTTSIRPNRAAEDG